MREALLVKTCGGTWLINCDLIASVIFNDEYQYLKVGMIGTKGYKFPYEDLLELEKIREAYSLTDFSNPDNEEGICS